MSEILDQSTVSSVRGVESQRPTITLGDLIAGCCVAAVGGVQLAVQAGHAAARALDEVEAKAHGECVRAVNSALVESVRTAVSARGALAKLKHIHLHLSDPGAIIPKIRQMQAALAQAPDHRGTLELVHSIQSEALAQHAKIVAAATFAKVTAAAEDIGLRISKALPDRGYLLAVGTAGETLRVDVKADTHTGNVNVNRDTDGFRWDACRVMDDQYTAALAKRGLEVTAARRTPKPRIRRAHVAQLHHT